MKLCKKWHLVHVYVQKFARKFLNFIDDVSFIQWEENKIYFCLYSRSKLHVRSLSLITEGVSFHNLFPNLLKHEKKYLKTYSTRNLSTDLSRSTSDC